MHRDTIYISLPITGHEDTYEKRRAEAVEQVRLLWPEAYIMTPDVLARRVTDSKPHGSLPSDGAYMAADIEFIIDRATYVFFCIGWESSKGCTVEMATAKAYNKGIRLQSALAL